MRINDLIKEYDKLKSQQILIASNINKTKKEIENATKQVEEYLIAKTILFKTIKTVNERFKAKLGDTITSAVQEIFGREIEVKIITPENNASNSKIVVVENDEEMDPKDDLGGSIINIIAFCIRVIFWKVSNPKKRNTIIMDEPFNWTGKLIQLVAVVVKQLSSEFNVQIIMVTHDDDLINMADRVFMITHDGKESHLKTIRSK